MKTNTYNNLEYKVTCIETYRDVLEYQPEIFAFWLSMNRMNYFDFRVECRGLYSITEELIDTFRDAYFGKLLVEQLEKSAK